MLIRPYIVGSGFDATEAYGFALAVKILARDREYILDVVGRSWDVPRPKVLEHDGIRLLLAENEAGRVAVFGSKRFLPTWSLLLKNSTSKRHYGDVNEECFRRLSPFLGPLHEMIGARSGLELRIAGHGFGAGLATLAALEFQQEMSDAKVIALGAPRVVSLNAGAGSDPGAEVIRIVNDDDLVARLAAHLDPFGETTWFDEWGAAQPGSSLPEELAEPVEVVGIEALRQALLWIENSETAPADPGAAKRIQATLQGLFPNLRAHAIDSYLRVLRRLGGQRVDWLREQPSTLPVTSAAAARFEALVAQQRADVATVETEAVSAAAEPLISVLLELDPPNWAPPEGVRLQSRIGPYATARLTADQLDRVRRDPAVRFAAIGREEGSPELIQSLPFIHADDAGLALPGPAGGVPVAITERGDCALFALIDTGIDILHSAFLDATGNSRIIGIWHQAGEGGPSPHMVHPGFSQDYGTLYTGAMIAGLIAGPGPLPGILRDLDGHGTHVASIGAGRAFGAAGRGVAPEVKILVVIPDVQVAVGDPKALGYSNSHVDALSFITEAAKGGNPLLDDPLPVAVNMSFGCNAGAHDGKSTLEAAIDAVTGIGRTPGVVLVKSAGNERNQGSHARVFPTMEWQPIDWDADATIRDRDYLEAWFSCRDELEFQLSCPVGVKDPSGAPIPALSVKPAQPTALAQMGGNAVSLRLTRFHPDNGDHMLAVDIARDQAPIHPGVWQLEVRAIQLASVQKALDLWLERRRISPLRFRVADPGYTLSVPGTAETVTTVSACDLSCCMSAFSSCGPTRTGGAKPDVCAPGDGISAARSNAGPSTFHTMSGTSMAAPHVAGLFALALSYRRKQAGAKQFNANQLRQMLNRSTQSFPKMHDFQSGYGPVDAAAFFREIAGHP